MVGCHLATLSGRWHGQIYMATPPDRQINRKAPATPHTTRAGGVRSERAPGQSEDKGAAAEQKKRWGLE